VTSVWKWLLFVSFAGLIAGTLNAQKSDQTLISIGPERLELHHVTAESVSYNGRSALRIVDAAPGDGDEVNRIAVVKGISLQDGAIEINLSGDTVPDAPQNLRGFVGIAFRVSSDASRFECFYLRPKNGRSEDQLQRNHSVQYISVPGFQWNKLRSEQPGKYESYVDLIPGKWTNIRIQIEGTSARLFVNGVQQPTLIVQDLKQPVEKGGIAFWIGPGTIAHFTELNVSR
jgi:hypothetical protein